MKYETIDIEVEEPTDEGCYIVLWCEDETVLSAAHVVYDKHYSFHEENTDCSGITHWLKPIK